MFQINFRTIEGRRLTNEMLPQTLNISNTMTITSLYGHEENLTVGFVFTCNYDPNFGFVRLEGEIMLDEAKENVEAAVKEWNISKGKHIVDNLVEKIHNSILSNCFIEAAIISRELKLPPPFPIPRIQQEKKESSQKKEEIGGVDTYIR